METIILLITILNIVLFGYGIVQDVKLHKLKKKYKELKEVGKRSLRNCTK